MANNPVLDKLGGVMPKNQIDPMIQPLVQLYQGLPCSPWDMVFRYIRPEQITQEQLDHFQAMANHIRPLWAKMMGR